MNKLNDLQNLSKKSIDNCITESHNKISFENVHTLSL